MKLRQMLFGEDHPSRLAIIRLGVVGKMQLVLELLHCLRAEYTYGAFVWMSVTNRETLEQGLLNTFRQLKIPGAENGNNNVTELFKAFLSSNHLPG